MKKQEIKELAEKMKELKAKDPLKFAELKGRIDAIYDMQQEAAQEQRLRGVS